MKVPVTAAVRVLRQHEVAFEPFLYPYKDRGGTRHSAACLGVDPHHVIKTIILEDSDRTPIIALMHGDQEVSTKTLARHIRTRTVRPCDPKVARKHTGYQVGGTSPFGARKRLPVYAPPTVLALDALWINGGKRGFLLKITGEDLSRVLQIQAVEGLGV